jgi:hypothetical protein
MGIAVGVAGLYCYSLVNQKTVKAEKAIHLQVEHHEAANDVYVAVVPCCHCQSAPRLR